MAAPTKPNLSCENQSQLMFCVIFNIPNHFHTCDLRSYFAQLIENNLLYLFHYRHRPIGLLGKQSIQQPLETPSFSSLEEPSKLSSSSDKKTKLQEICCGIFLTTHRVFERLGKAYNLHHWVDEKGCHDPRQCLIHPIYVEKDVDCSIKLHPDFTSTKAAKDQLVMKISDLMELKEMKPPDIMPQGNVGTPTSHFLHLINTCRLPPIIVKKLGLKFKKGATDQAYTAVPFNYSNMTSPEDLSKAAFLAGAARTFAGKRILTHTEYRRHVTMEAKQKEGQRAQRGNTPPAADKGNSSDEAEQWDLTEALVDDAGNYERNKEKLFEEKIELKWEKGGSGLVFYTDAQHWRKLEGDFDEQTADDWDVDLQYYEFKPGTSSRGGGAAQADLDARHSFEMRQSTRLREGLDQPSAFSNSGELGAFELHTKGVGRRVLESQGWTPGHGVGKDETGRAEVVEDSGKHPRDKTGIGYHGEKVQRYVVKSKKRRDDEIRISTVYDNPKDYDEPDELYQRKNPHNIKHRHGRYDGR